MSELGRLLIQFQGTVLKLDFHTEDERDQFLRDYSEGLTERLRQQVLTWRAGKLSRNRMGTGQPDPAGKASELADAQRRERERSKARRRAE